MTSPAPTFVAGAMLGTIATVSTFAQVPVSAEVPASAQAPVFARDVEFARALARELRFIGLAKAETDRLSAEYTERGQLDELRQLAVDVLLIGATVQRDAQRRRELFESALDASAQLIENTRVRSVANEARMTFARAAVRYGRSLLDELTRAREAGSPDLSALEARAVDLYRRAVDQATALVDALEPFADSDETAGRYYHARLLEAVLRRDLAAASEARDRAHLARVARTTFEDLILEVGEETLLGLRAWFEMSRIDEIAGAPEDAVASFEDTVEAIVFTLDQDDLDLPRATRIALTELMQEAYAAATRILLRDGETRALALMLEEFRRHVIDHVAGDDVGDDALVEIVSPQHGHSVLLTEAEALAETGDRDDAARAVERTLAINAKHPFDPIGIRAKAILREISQRSNLGLPPMALFEIAKGDYQRKDYAVAARSLKRALAAMTDADRAAHGIEGSRLLGRCYALRERYLEATLAFARGLERHARNAEPRAVELVAEHLDRAWGAFRSRSRFDDAPPLRALDRRVAGLLRRHGGAETAAKRFWSEATRLLRQEDYARAAELYERIGVESPYYEPAQRRRVICLSQLGELDAAKEIIRAYREWLHTPVAGSPESEAAHHRRAVTRAAMAFLEVSIDEDLLFGGEDDPAPARIRGLVERIDRAIEAFADAGAEYVPRTLHTKVRLLCELGELDDAVACYRRLRREYTDTAFVPASASRVFLALRDRASTEAADGSAGESLRRRALEIALEYVADAPDPSYGLVHAAMEAAADVGDWEAVEHFARELVDRYGSRPSHRARVAQFVAPVLGEALLRQHDVEAAAAVLEEVVDAHPNDYRSKRLLARALGGWVAFDDQLNEVVHPGLDRPREAYRLMWVDYRRFVRAKVEEYSLEWYRFVWESFYYAWRASRTSADHERYADILYRKAHGVDAFATLQALGPEGRELYQLFLGRR